MKLSGQAVADFLSGEHSMRDGTLIGLSLKPGEAAWEPILKINFNVPAGARGSIYELSLWNDLKFDYLFSNESTLQQIAFFKCLWTDDATFYLSLDPWKESERLPSDQDKDCFQSNP
jgi:hypothetical protein